MSCGPVLMQFRHTNLLTLLMGSFNVDKHIELCEEMSRHKLKRIRLWLSVKLIDCREYWAKSGLNAGQKQSVTHDYYQVYFITPSHAGTRISISWILAVILWSLLLSSYNSSVASASGTLARISFNFWKSNWSEQTEHHRLTIKTITVLPFPSGTWLLGWTVRGLIRPISDYWFKHADL